MAFRLTAADRQKLSEHARILAQCKDRIEDELAAVNAKLPEVVVDLNDRIDQYNEKLREAQEFISNLASDWRSDYDDKSDGWRDGDRGQEADSFICQWEEFESNCDELTHVRLEEAALDPSEWANEAIENLPEDAG
jgi:hypothetical protein